MMRNLGGAIGIAIRGHSERPRQSAFLRLAEHLNSSNIAMQETLQETGAHFAGLRADEALHGIQTLSFHLARRWRTAKSVVELPPVGAALAPRFARLRSKASARVWLWDLIQHSWLPDLAKHCGTWDDCIKLRSLKKRENEKPRCFS
jgi:hypothetical protein